MSETSPRLDLPYLQASQAQKHVTHNEALKRLDTLTQLVVEGFAAETPPAAPAPGEVHALGGLPTGAWAGQAGTLAAWDGVAWGFVAPKTGWRAWGRAEAELRVFDGTDWIAADGGHQDLDGVGIGTAWDAGNRLAVAAAASLFTHAGAGHQVKVNKAAAADTASLLFQTAFSGRAEMGLAGDDDFAIKVSADGAAWTEALAFDKTSGLATGAAVQASASDAAAGRLLRNGAHGLGASMIEFSGNIDDATALPTGFYRVVSGATGTKPGTFTSFNMLMIRRATGLPHANTTQVAYHDVTGDIWSRGWNGTVWTAWSRMFSRTNVLATVSQSGGVPTGGLIERGSNANGEYVRFADGTQICTGFTSSLAIGTASGASYVSAGFAWAYPAAFSVAPAAHGGDRTGGGGWLYGASGITTTGGTYVHASFTSLAAATLRMFAIGRWF